MNRNSPPTSRTVQKTLQTREFFHRLIVELITARHTQLNHGGTVTLHCFRRHLRRANEDMTHPFPRLVL